MNGSPSVLERLGGQEGPFKTTDPGSAPNKGRSSFRLEVTQADIDKALKCSSQRCIVASAIKRQIPEAMRIEVDSQAIRMTYQDQRLIYLTPWQVQNYVVDFDAGDDIEPFSFQLREPYRVARQALTEEGKAITRERNAARKAVKATKKRATGASAGGDKAIAAHKAAAEKAAATKQTTKKAATGVKMSKTDNGGRRAQRRVYKTGIRRYGMRQLRINKDRED